MGNQIGLMLDTVMRNYCIVQNIYLIITIRQNPFNFGNILGISSYITCSSN
mgnify:CR=1 FL=1